MLSPADMLIIGAVALIAFGPDQLPKVARRAGQVMRDVQNTSQGFIREMERVAEDADVTHDVPHVPESPMYGRISEPRPAPEPFDEQFDAAIPEHDVVAPEHPAMAPSEPRRRKFSASESS